jgi:hypothetical protein
MEAAARQAVSASTWVSLQPLLLLVLLQLQVLAGWLAPWAAARIAGLLRALGGSGVEGAGALVGGRTARG